MAFRLQPNRLIIEKTQNRRKKDAFLLRLFCVCHDSLIGIVVQAHILIEELKTFLAIQFLHVVAELLTSPKDAVKLIVAETNAPVVGDGTTIIDLTDIGPHTGAEAHVARLSRGVEFTTREVVGAQMATCVSDGSHLAMTGGVMVT